MKDFCSTGDQITQKTLPTQPQVIPNDPTTLEIAATTSLKDFFEDLIDYGHVAYAEFCLNSVLTCQLLDSLGGPFSHEHIRLGNIEEKFAIYATQVAEGYLTPEMYL